MLFGLSSPFSLGAQEHELVQDRDQDQDLELDFDASFYSPDESDSHSSSSSSSTSAFSYTTTPTQPFNSRSSSCGPTLSNDQLFDSLNRSQSRSPSPPPPPHAHSTAQPLPLPPLPAEDPSIPSNSFASAQAAMAQQNSSHSQNLIGHTIDNGRLEFISILGLGAYGVVYLARDVLAPRNPQPTSRAHPALGHQPLYAVKCLNKVGLDPRQRSFQCREILLHGLASHHGNVVTLYNVIEEETCIYVVLEFCEEGDLFGMITERQRYLGDDALIRDVFLQILDAVEHCHGAGIFHRDLKPENILCQDDGRKVVLADFGLATSDTKSGDFGCGSTFYMSPGTLSPLPTVMKNPRADPEPLLAECQGGLFQRLGCYSTSQNDVWSLGVILVNLACGRNPWKQACPSDETFRAYLANPDFLRSILPISDHTNRILKRVFALNPQARIGLAELRQEILAVKTFTMTEEELRGATRATREAARAFAQAGKKEAQVQAAREQREDEEEELRLGMQDEDAHSGYTATTEDDDDCSLSSPPISPWNSTSAHATVPASPPTPTQARPVRAPPTPPQTPRRAHRPIGIHPPPHHTSRISPSSSSSSGDSLSPCPSSASSTLASDSAPSRYTTPPQHSRSVFNPVLADDALPPSPNTPSLRRPRRIPTTSSHHRRHRKTSGESSSSSSSGASSQPPTPTSVNPVVRIVSVDDAADELLHADARDHEMMDGASKASYTAYYPVFADWADHPDSHQGKHQKSNNNSSFQHPRLDSVSA
ncbi:hypothetical protein RQP46_007976 [Phenoliferia psychrophenolica]